MTSLAHLHTFGLNATAQSVTYLTSSQQAADWLRDTAHQRRYILGEGSNTIFVENFEGHVAVNQLKGIQVEEFDDHFIVNVAAGENWHNFVDYCLRQEIFGLENLALIPGTVGAAPIQNIGAYGREVEYFIQQVNGLRTDSGEPFSVSHKDCKFGYRDSIFKHELKDKVLITDVTFFFSKRWLPCTHYAGLDDLVSPTPRDIFDQVIAIRRSKLPDPAVMGNAGSFFKNPKVSQTCFNQLNKRYPQVPHYPQPDGSVKLAAAWLIDQCKFKGVRRGGVICHKRQPLVLANAGQGTGEDLMALAREILSSVKQQFDVELENEVRLIGATGGVSL